MSNPFSLAGKHIVVTGASSGIGRACAIHCSRAGAMVLLIGRNQQRLDETITMMENPGKHMISAVNLTDFGLVEAVLKSAVEKNGRFHGLVNAAGISTTLPLKLITAEKLDDYFRTNVHAAVNISRIFSKQAYLYNDGGSIILFSSVMGIVGEVGKTIYSLTKGALISGAKSMALELAPRKIRVNSVSPGVVITPMSQKAVYSQDEESLNKITAMHPLGLGQPEDVANACIFLLSDASRWITGTNLVIDGGYTAR